MRRLTKNSKIDEGLLAAFITVSALGLVMIYSTSSILAENKFGSDIFFLKNQIKWLILSAIVVFFIMKMDLQRLSLYSAPALLLVIFMLCLVFLWNPVNGSQRWIKLGIINIQPSELFKFVMIMFLAFSLSKTTRDITDLKQLLFPYTPIIGIGLLLIVMEPDLGTAIVIALTAIGVFFLAGAKIKHLFMGLAPVGAGAAFMVFVLGYKKARITDYISSISDPLAGSYQVKQAALTLGSGGIFGMGLGDGRQKLFFLPYPHTDFIFAAIGEEVGLIGLTIILMLFFYIIYRGFKIASNQPDKFGYILASGITLSLFLNIAINLGVVTVLLPVTGLPLPFISYGGSSFLISSAMIGVLLNLSRRMVRR
ncbi:MAG: putative lipid II flippase FtsW [Calditrichaeota bacterium]|nr:MAG: putative lipid II flippase FtsW [Calditrichota bacterium]